MLYQATNSETVENIVNKGAPISPSILSGLAGFIEALILLASGYGLGLALLEGIHHNYWIVILPATALIVSWRSMDGAYDYRHIRGAPRHPGRVFIFSSLLFLGIKTFAPFITLGYEITYTWLFSWLFSGFIAIMVVRAWVYLLLHRLARKGKLVRNIVIFGDREQTEKVLMYFTNSRQPVNRILGVFLENSEGDRSAILGHAVLGDVGDLADFGRKYRLDDVILALPWNKYEKIIDAVDKISELPVNIGLSSEMKVFRHAPKSLREIGGAPIIDISEKPVTGWEYVLKTIEDKVLGLLFLIVASPLFLLISILIKSESEGPVFFRQARQGINNKVFSVFKFRTMYHNRPAEAGVPQATKNDPRVTRIGRILRRTSMDELPQLINVLQGDMSLVGPRPHAVEHGQQYSKVVDRYYSRHRVKPGLTGLAQVHGLRGETENIEHMEERVKYDLEYIENWSVFLDLRILIMTGFVVFTQKSAY